MRKDATALLAILPILAGCATSPLDDGKSRLPLEPQNLAALPAKPYVQSFPLAPKASAPEASKVRLEEPLPVWENAKIQKVLVDAYVDDKGNLPPESCMYVVVKDGGWNMDAVRRPDNYIPPENAVKPMDGFDASYGNSYALPMGREDSPSSMMLFDGRNVRLTGLFRKSDAEAARRLCDNSKEVAIYDAYLGWVIAPKSAMSAQVNAHNAYRAEVSKHDLANEFGKIGQLPQQAQQEVRIPPPRQSEAVQAPTEEPESTAKNLFDDF